MKQTARPVAYIRRSARSRSDPGDISKEFQTETVRRLAGPDGPALTILDRDWGKSAATEKTDQRLDFLALLESIERGEVTALYAYATDRLARSVEWAARLLNAARRAGTVIVTSEGRFEPDNDLTDQLFYFQAMQNEGYSRQSKRKRDATVERLRARGEKLGPPFYGGKPGENVNLILDTFREAGSVHKTARLLNERHIPTRHPVSRKGGTTMWTHATVRQILVRHGLVPRFGVQGAKPRADHRLYRLLRCPCGRILSGVVTGGVGRNRRTIYRCVNGSADPAHGPKSIAEAKILPAIMAEAARLSPPVDQVQMQLEADAKRREIDARLERIIDAFIDGAIDKQERDRRRAPLQAELDRLGDATSIVELPAIDWTWPPARLNGVLRSLWTEIRLGSDLQPVEFSWTVPEWRAA